MININELKKYYSNLQGFDKSILREYLQYKILYIIFKNDISSKLSFLGETAIKICYGSPRFSEDLDFDNFNLSKEDFNQLSSYIKKELEYEGYEVEIRNVFKGAFRCYIKIPKLLYENKLSGYQDEKIVIQIDTATHNNFEYQAHDFLLQKFDVFGNIKLTPKDIILSQKIGAIFGRKRAKGRDFYDVVYLMGMTDFNFDYLNFKFNIKNKKELKKELLNKVSKFNFKELSQDVLPFLINPDDQNRIIDFKEYIEQEL
jgi:predicted nucleotidyltransferase component of viral defense system